MKRDFIFDNKYIFEYKNKKLKIRENLNYIEKFFSIDNRERNIYNITSIIGRNGSGKTALMSILLNIIYRRKYLEMDTIIIFKIEDKFHIIAKKGIIDNVETSEDYKIEEYNEQTINFDWKIYKKITSIYFSNVINLRNDVFPKTREKDNFLNISLLSDLKMDFRTKYFYLSRVDIIDNFIDERFEDEDFKVINNYRIAKNIKFLSMDNIVDELGVKNIVLNLQIFNKTISFLGNTLDELRIYKKFPEEIKLDEDKEYFLVSKTTTENKIYELLTTEFKNLEKNKTANDKELVRNYIFLVIIDKYFNELYSRINNVNIIKLINKNINNKIGEKIESYNSGFEEIKKILKELEDEELYKEYLKSCTTEEKKEELAKFFVKRFKSFIDSFNKKYNNIFKAIEEMINIKEIKNCLVNSGYIFEGRIYANYRPCIIIERKDFEKIYDMVLEYSDITDIFLFEYKGLSSGEQAFLDIYSEIYDIKDKTTDSIIIFMDEPELYLHPEWQRELIYRLIEYFNKYFKGKKIQIIFSSNSPYTLSDMPKDNVIFLERKDDKFNTFSNNIYALLKEKYFMKSTIGEFAKTKIEQIIKNINIKDGYENFKRQEDLKIVNAIGDNLLRNKILEMMSDKINDKN